MSSLYQRGDSAYWWIKFRDAMGVERRASTGKTDHAEAEQVLLEIERAIRTEKKTGATKETIVDAYRETWLKRREEMGIASVRDDRGRFHHLSRAFLSMPLARVTREDVRTEVRTIWTSGELAPRTIRKVYEALRVMFTDAVADGLVKSTPCTLEERRKELPPAEDADPTWRDEAQLGAEDLESLLSDERISLYRRVIYGLQFLGAMRVSEVADRRFADLREAEPLPRLVISSSWSRKDQEARGTKTGRNRSMPIHPALSHLLVQWGDGGWQGVFGRAPTDADLLVPSLRGPSWHLNSNTSLDYLHGDLELLGLKRVRQHDGRRTLISLARSADANAELLKWATHGRGKKVIDAYTTPQWKAVCATVAAVKLGYGELRSEKSPVFPRGSECPGRDSKAPTRPDHGHQQSAQHIDSNGISLGRRLSRARLVTTKRNPQGTVFPADRRPLGNAEDWALLFLADDVDRTPPVKIDSDAECSREVES